MIITEGVLVGLIGGFFGTIAAIVVLTWGQFSMSIDGQNIPFEAQTSLLLTGAVLSIGLGILAGIVPAWQATRSEIAHCFRAV